jgi:hypothetical protein
MKGEREACLNSVMNYKNIIPKKNNKFKTNIVIIHNTVKMRGLSSFIFLVVYPTSTG